MKARLEHGRRSPLPVQDAYQRLLPLPLPDLFSRRYLALPAIREVREQVGP